MQELHAPLSNDAQAQDRDHDAARFALRTATQRHAARPTPDWAGLRQMGWHGNPHIQEHVLADIQHFTSLFPDAPRPVQAEAVEGWLAETLKYGKAELLRVVQWLFMFVLSGQLDADVVEEALDLAAADAMANQWGDAA